MTLRIGAMSDKFTLVTISVLIACVLNLSCAHQKIPVILDHPPKDVSYEVIGKVENIVEWHSLQWLWFWWHYMPWYPSVYKVHEKKLIKQAKRMGADAIINVDHLPDRSGATGEAIRYT